MKQTSVPGQKAKYIIIRAARAPARVTDGAWDEAVSRLRETYKALTGVWPTNTGAQFHLVLTIEKPEASIDALELENEELRDNITVLRDKLARAEKECDEAGQVAEMESRERKRLQREEHRRGLFDPRIAEYIRRTEAAS